MAKKKSKIPTAQPASSSPSTSSVAADLASLTIGGVSVQSTPQPRPGGTRIKNIISEFDRYFGNDTKLENWQRLCGDVGVDGELLSIRKCKQALIPVWVNIHDLIHAVRHNRTPPRRFQTQRELSQYTKKNRRYYPREKAKEGGPIRALLAHIS
ncbi:hypothetical protein N431DRAFT_476696 [Stipitochalara longipes BDJ]|nr:hypothetical protein N431DRAFT_476696 [Stipitochalara longipes BDJ]